MKWLLPYRFKRWGLVLAPIGFLLWLAMQKGLTKALLLSLFAESDPMLRSVNAGIAILSFFSFLAGVYFIAFSKEAVEDEMIQKIRLDSFQFAALIQLIALIIGFVLMLVVDFNEGILMLFFILLLFVFWVSFIGRFNYVLWNRLKQSDEE